MGPLGRVAKCPFPYSGCSGHIHYLRILFQGPALCRCACSKGVRFYFLQISLPDLDTVATEGLTKEEILDLKDFATDNEALIWEMAREGGPKLADAV